MTADEARQITCMSAEDFLQRIYHRIKWEAESGSHYTLYDVPDKKTRKVVIAILKEQGYKIPWFSSGGSLISIYW